MMNDDCDDDDNDGDEGCDGNDDCDGDGDDYGDGDDDGDGDGEGDGDGDGDGDDGDGDGDCDDSGHRILKHFLGQRVAAQPLARSCWDFHRAYTSLEIFIHKKPHSLSHEAAATFRQNAKRSNSETEGRWGLSC